MEIEPNTENQTTNKQQRSRSSSKSRKPKQPTGSSKPFQLFSCPFVNYKPADIEDFAFGDGLLAVARNNSTIDIYSYPSWAQIHTVRFDKETPVRRIAWIKNDKEPVLLVAFLNSMLSVYSLKNIKPLVTKIVTGNAIWDLTISTQRDEIAVACDDGSTSIYKYEGEDDLYLHRTLRSFQEKALSVAYDANPQNKNVLYVGYENGTIRKFDLASGNVVLTMNLSPKELIWKVLSIRNEDCIVVGSSKGTISFFETKFGTLRSELKTHEADVLCLEINANHSIIYATGLDSKIVTLEKITGTSETGRSGTDSWIVSSADRGQSHDVKALKLLEDNILISGGLTTDICIYNLDNGRFVERKGKLLGQGKEDIKLRHITCLPNNRVMSVAGLKNVLVFARDFSLEIWKYDVERMDYNFIIEMKVKSSPIIAFAVSYSGKHIAYSTLEETVVYKLEVKNIKIEKLASLPPSSSMIFNQSGTKLFKVNFNSTLHSYEMAKNKSQELVQLPGDIQGQFFNIEIANNRDILAIGSRIGKKLFVYNCEEENKKENVVEQVSDLIVGEHFTCFKFGTNSDQLIVVYESNKFMIYNWKDKVLSKWSREHSNRFPLAYLKRYNKVVGIVCNPKNASQIILYTNYYYIRIHLGERIPKKIQVIRPENKSKKQRSKSQNNKMNEETKEEQKANENTNFQICYRKNPIVQFEMLKDGRLICLETSWKDFSATLPGAINAKKYGL